MKLQNINIASLEAIAEKAQRAYTHLNTLKEISEKSRQNKMPILITKEEAAELLQISVSHLGQLRHRGTGPRFTKIGNAIYYNVPDLLDYMDSCSYQSTAEVPVVKKQRQKKQAHTFQQPISQ